MSEKELLPKNINIPLSGEAIKKLDEMCISASLSRQEIIHEMIEEFHERYMKDESGDAKKKG